MRLAKSKDIGLLIIRVVLGVTMIAFHGIPKITGGVEMLEKIGGSMRYIGINFLPVVWGGAAAAVEIVAAGLFILGLWTRPASVLLAVTMLVATVYHLGEGHGLARSSHTIELLAVFVAFIFMGAGRYSVDKK